MERAGRTVCHASLWNRAIDENLGGSFSLESAGIRRLKPHGSGYMLRRIVEQHLQENPVETLQAGLSVGPTVAFLCT